MIFFDLGSNTVRAISVDMQKGVKLGSFEAITRTAQKTFKTSLISDEARARVVAAINSAFEKLGRADAIGVATAVYRQTKNSKVVLEEILNKTGLNVKVIDGETEAWLTSVAINEALGQNENYILVDIGGASTEVIVQTGPKMIVQSFDFGIVGIAEKYKNHDAILNAVVGAMEPVKDFLQDCRHGFAKPAKFCATSGTPATIAALSLGMSSADYDESRINGVVVSHEETKKQMKRLLTLSADERARLVGVGREDLIIAGCAIFEQMYTAAGFNECSVFESGLREGLAIAYARKLIDFGDGK